MLEALCSKSADRDSTRQSEAVTFLFAYKASGIVSSRDFVSFDFPLTRRCQSELAQLHGTDQDQHDHEEILTRRAPMEKK